MKKDAQWWDERWDVITKAGTFDPDKLEQPSKWEEPRRIFVCSTGDPFHESVETEHLDQIFSVAHKCSEHKFLFLTKRPENILLKYSLMKKLDPAWFSNCWFGASAENQETADERIPELLRLRV